MKDPQLEGCIRFWEAKRADRYLMNESTQVLIEQTIDFLKELQSLKDRLTGLPFKITTIGPERSVPEGTQIRFLFEDEYQAFRRNCIEEMKNANRLVK